MYLETFTAPIVVPYTQRCARIKAAKGLGEQKLWLGGTQSAEKPAETFNCAFERMKSSSLGLVGTVTI